MGYLFDHLVLGMTSDCCSSNSRAGLTLLVTGTGTGNQMGRLCVRLFLWRPLPPPTRWPSHGSIAGHLGRFDSLGRTELERLRNYLDIRRCLPRPSRGQHGTIVTRNGQAGHVQLWTAKQRQDLFLETGQDLLGNGTSHRVLDGHDGMRPSGTEW